MSSLEVVILAAGKGTRMNSAIPKVLQTIGGRPMLARVLDTAMALNPVRIHVVIGHGAEEIQQAFAGHDVNWVYQENQLGTGHAVAQALPFCQRDAKVLVLYGDVPLLDPSLLNQLVGLSVPGKSIGLLAVSLADPHGYGRVIRNEHGKVASIVEQKDATADQLQVCEVNTGILVVGVGDLARWLPRLESVNSQNEFYLTDIVAMAVDEGLLVETIHAARPEEVMGVNNRQQQAQLERVVQLASAKKLMDLGVMLVDPARFDCRGEVLVGTDVCIDVNVVLEGKVTLGNGVFIEPGCIIKNSEIGDGARIKAYSHVDGARIERNVEVGPFARLRPGTLLGAGSRIGNFVETKNAVFGYESKANHLAYIGDAEVGSSCNIGAGTITCNYDGVNKHKTIMGDNVFVGSNATLVAPLHIENGGFVGAGSTITKTVPAETLAVGRGQQRNIPGWTRPAKKPKS